MESIEHIVEQLLVEEFTKIALQEKLNPLLWDRKLKIKPKIRKDLLTIVRDFLKGDDTDPKLTVTEISITGSMANYNWSNQSDIDLHYVAGFKTVKEKLIKQIWTLKTVAWNQLHDVKIEGFEVELYLQDETEPHYSTGVYSLSKNSWITKPTKFDHEVIDWDNVFSKAHRMVKAIDGVEQLFNSKEYTTAYTQGQAARKRIRKARAAGLEAGGEMSIENLVYKVLHRSGDLDRIVDLITKAYDCGKTIGKSKNC